MEQESRARKSVKHPSGGETRTKQSDALESDINSIMSRYVKQGYVMGPGAPPKYGDFSAGIDYHEAMSRVCEAQEAFLHLPAHIKKHCRQDPGEFLDMVYDAERRAELVELGLLENQVPEKAKEVEAEPAPPEAEGEPAA